MEDKLFVAFVAETRRRLVETRDEYQQRAGMMHTSQLQQFEDQMLIFETILSIADAIAPSIPSTQQESAPAYWSWAGQSWTAGNGPQP